MCKQCLAVCTVPDGVDPHTMAWCNCCTDDHHHGEGAAACSESQHPGQPCWNPPMQPVRPDECGVCRPIVHFGVAGHVIVPGTAGMIPGVS
jgi:hypothetical protein